MKHDVTDLALAPGGKLRIEWAEAHMPVLRMVRERFERDATLKGVKLAACLHVTTETAVLARTLAAGGAEVALCASNPLSTQDDVAASLVADYGIPVFARRGEDRDAYYAHIDAVLDIKPNQTLDDGADLVSQLHGPRRDLAGGIAGSCEETTTGVIRLRALERDGKLLFPVIAVNDANTKHLFDNRYGTGQSTLDGILRATNVLLAGCEFVVCGYGSCGKGVAERARGMGAHVTVCEVAPLAALQAVMDGFRVAPLSEAASWGQVFVTVSGDTSVIRREHFKVMRDGAILANAGHFNVEIDIPALAKMAGSRREVRPQVEEFALPDGRRLYLLAQGRLVNLAAAEGHPAVVMDMSFANQALSVAWVKEKAGKLERRVYTVPAEIDDEVARLKLSAMGISIDSLTDEQKKYLDSWEAGT